MEQAPKAKHGYRRDKRGAGRPVVSAVVLRPADFPLAYEIRPGTTSDKPTRPLFLEKIQAQYGQAKRIWIINRGMPTEATLTGMRSNDPTASHHPDLK